MNGKPIEATVEVLEQMLQHKPILWVGSGASILAGRLTTRQLLEAMQKACDDPISDLDNIFDGSDHFIRSMGKGEFISLTQNLLGKKWQVTVLHRAIARLARHGCFHAVITTNFDDLLEQAFRDEGIKYSLQSIESNQGVVAGLPLIKVHNSLDDWQKSFSSGQSLKTWTEKYNLPLQYLNQRRKQKRLLFVGSAMRDPALLDWLAMQSP